MLDFTASESASTTAHLGLPVPGGVHWFWVGTHGEYDKLVG